MKNRLVYQAVATLMGTVIGAGVLGIPYVVGQSGYLVGLFWAILLGVGVLVLNLYLGEVILRTKGFHQLTGYCERYLGKKGKLVMAISMLIGIYGALLAYIIGVGETLNSIFPSISSFIFSMLFFVIVSYFVYIGISLIKRAESGIGTVMILIVVTIIVIVLFSKHFSFENLSMVNPNKIFVPYGVILFAYLGAVAIPEMHEILVMNKKLLKRAIIFGSLIPILIYILFPLAMVGISGASIAEISTITLGVVYGKWMNLFANLFAVFAMTTSFLTLGLALKEMYVFDYKVPHLASWGVTVFVPLWIFLAGFKDFIKTLWIAGSFAAGLDGILIVLMHWKCRKQGNRKPEYVIRKSYLLGTIVMALFLMGIAYQLFFN
ncbi:hypothetical protein KY330_01775 [Candidatus Woesearchaeota archaeon]|nr:hypothetical protein [Candidatus Woesearchaeota archaeon]